MPGLHGRCALGHQRQQSSSTCTVRSGSWNQHRRQSSIHGSATKLAEGGTLCHRLTHHFTRTLPLTVNNCSSMAYRWLASLQGAK